MIGGRSCLDGEGDLVKDEKIEEMGENWESALRSVPIKLCVYFPPHRPRFPYFY